MTRITTFDDSKQRRTVKSALRIRVDLSQTHQQHTLYPNVVEARLPFRSGRNNAHMTRDTISVTTNDIFGATPAIEPAAPGSYGLWPAGYRLPVATRLGRVRLQVANLTRSLAFYEGT
jgi:hypothetical protein